jgi:hypothetical protein
MRIAASVLPAALLLLGTAGADVHMVTNTDDSGPGSLRWAIDAANLYGGADTITFDPGLSGSTIYPETPLSPITDSRTTIDGDINDDGAPDIELRGSLLTVGGHGLTIKGNRTTIIGLAISKFTWSGIRIIGVSNCKIRACHVGVALDGWHGPGNDRHDIYLSDAEDTVIGGRGTNGRNIVCGGAASRGTFGIGLLQCRRTTIVGNYIGVTRDGTATFGRGGYGIGLVADEGGPECAENTIGGNRASEHNVLGGLKQAILLLGASRNVIAGNYLGLAPDGNSVRRIGQWAIGVGVGSCDNTIGGTTPGERNVIAGANIGVFVLGRNTSGNTIQGNYFGLNAAGTRQRSFGTGVLVSEGGENLTIGGDSAAAGNYFTSKDRSSKVGAYFVRARPGIVIGHNKFGVRPNGRDALVSDYGICILAGSAQITDNEVVRAAAGIALGGTSGDRFGVFRNRIRRCVYGVSLLGNARFNLGDLGNTPTSDDGRNRFIRSNLWHIYNTSTSRVKAEGNSFGTTNRSEIDAKIYDKRDNSSYGRVDFSPLIGGVLPAGEAEPILAITGATAVPTSNGGAQITFALSAPASVTATVLNLAGRPVRELCHARACAAGRNSLTWHGCSDGGLAVAGGMYLVRMAARDDEGQQSSALTQVRVRR